MEEFKLKAKIREDMVRTQESAMIEWVAAAVRAGGGEWAHGATPGTACSWMRLATLRCRGAAT